MGNNMLKKELEKELGRLDELYTCANREVSKLSRVVGEQAEEKRKLEKTIRNREAMLASGDKTVDDAIECIVVLMSVNCRADMVIMQDKQQGLHSDDRTSDLFNHLNYIARKLDMHYLNRVL